MRHLKICTLLLTFVSPSIFADDIIVFRNGEIVNAIVTEVTTTEVKYKKASNSNGPIYSANKETVLSIKYENGEIDKFDTKVGDSKDAENKETKRIKATPAEDNAQEKAQYATLPRLNLKTSNKKSKDFFPIMAFTDSSVISTNELKIIVTPEGAEFYDGGWKVKIGYTFTIVNKTDAPIYIDRANCFKRFNNGNTQSYFDNKQYTVTNNNASGISVGLGIGGIGVVSGGMSGSSDSETFGVDRFLVIGPKSKANLIDYKYIRLSEKKAKFKTVSDIEYWGFDLLCAPNITEGEVKTYTEDSSPYKNMYYITYSTDSDFKTNYNIKFELYAKYLVGAKMKKEKWSMAAGATKIVQEIQKIVPDFWTKSLTIVGAPGKFE